MILTVRALQAWPYPAQPERPATYKVSYRRTLQDLEAELVALHAREVIVGLVVRERDVRLDGQLRADAKVDYPGVELSFRRDESPQRLVFHTDRHRGYRESWQDNLRAIALGLEALRAVSRYGITETDQQYAGFAALTAGIPLEALGAELVERYGSVNAALRATHPDTGSGEHSTRDFQAVTAYRDSQRVPA